MNLDPCRCGVGIIVTFCENNQIDDITCSKRGIDKNRYSIAFLEIDDLSAQRRDNSIGKLMGSRIRYRSPDLITAILAAYPPCL